MTENIKKYKALAFSLSKIYEALKGDVDFCMLSANRHEFSSKENKEATIKLEKELRSLGCGFVKMKGGYMEKDESGQEVLVIETSFFVRGLSKIQAINLCKKYGQDSILWKDKDGCRYIDKNGQNQIFFKGITQEKEAVKKYFTELKKGKRKFSFVSEVIPNSFARCVQGNMDEERLLWKAKSYQEVTSSSLSKIYSKIQQGNCGIISAFRDGYTRNENLKRTESLKVKLARPGLSIVKVLGTYAENYKMKNEKWKQEISFFVCDIKNQYNLKAILQELGEVFEQDSIFYIPKGGQEGYLIGTNKIGYPGYKKIVKYSGASFGKESQFMSKINGRPFHFKEVLGDFWSPNVMSMMGICTARKKNWKEFEIDSELLEKLK